MSELIERMKSILEISDRGIFSRNRNCETPVTLIFNEAMTEIKELRERAGELETVNRALSSAARANLVRVEELENNIQIMVEKAASKSLDGYRELGARAAAAENRVDELEKEIQGWKKLVLEMGD